MRATARIKPIAMHLLIIKLHTAVQTFRDAPFSLVIRPVPLLNAKFSARLRGALAVLNDVSVLDMAV